MKKPLCLAISLAVLALAADVRAEAILDPELQTRLGQAGPHRVVVTFSDRDQVARIAGITDQYLLLSELPMAGALLTTAQIREVAQWEGVESIYLDAPLRYFNHEAGEITGGHLVHDTLGLKGRGVTVAVLDSGIDANHPDLSFGSKTIQNVKLIGDLGLAGVAAALENQPNTDTSSGHGTHVAGTVAGTGAASATDHRRPYYYDGIAPEADLIGLGAGEAISILFALQGFDWVLANQQRYGIDIVTNSWGSSNSVYDPNNPINKASYEAYRRGMVVSFAAGNDGPAENTLNPYAIVPWVINVGSGTKARDLSSFSSRGIADDPYKRIDVIAPGSNICSTRAVGTPIGALGPVVNLTYPSYTLHYHCISGTSMATPFVAGTAALLLEANPGLSPDQIEQILVQTADPMPYPTHWVGGGYINVARAVEVARRTVGERQRFLSGVTAWSSQGIWNAVADRAALVDLDGRWKTVAHAEASDGSYQAAAVTKKDTPRARLAFSGTAFQLLYPRNSKGGVADVYVDGSHRGRISFYNPTPDFERFAINGMNKGLHRIELRGIQGQVYFDGVLTDGPLFPSDTVLVEETQTFAGTMGPSVENLQIDEYTIEVGSDTTTIRAELRWGGGIDLDLYLLDPEGNQVASAATLANPEVLEFAVKVPGTYTYQVTGYATVVADYTLTSTQVRAVSGQ
ncbi:S8 family serine peptidase [Rehaibacterium terrae]|jgi:serine protease AprX|uniref:Subtilisin family serine protease n=1 Tax=Rehaibacterium terrae TaxID=1341696 RepID=A0A7W7Y0T7_9GAMM|nr:S8 family serine peptidase [Rehaibacterium terrae]MBB5016011.1 subtilisin family serine protease [Rehaibacterium terrae]